MELLTRQTDLGGDDGDEYAMSYAAGTLDYLDVRRFLVIERPYPGEAPSASVCTEREVSRRYDMLDCYGEAFDVYYMANDGSLQPVTIGAQERVPACDWDERSIVYAHSPLIAAGKCVGYVTHTDH